MRVFLWNRRCLTSVLSYLAALSWDVAHAESTCSWIELALDFESCMHVMLPPPGELSPKTDQLGLNTATLAARGSTLHNMYSALKCLFDQQSPNHPKV